jgi:3-oxoacyl-[acyl-carrier protein] reductase
VPSSGKVGGNLDGKVAIVTGAGRGIGLAIVLKLAREGARVVANELDATAAEEMVAEVKAAGGQVVPLVGDITSNGFGERAVAMAVETFGGLDIVVNNAGFTWDAVIQKMTDEQWDKIIDVHLSAPFRILRAAQPHFKERSRDEAARGLRVNRKVVNISSLSGLGGNAGQANYASAKAGIVGLTKTLAREWGRYNVNVNAVAYGVIATRLSAVAAGTGASINVGGQDVKIGVSREILEAAEKGIPLGRVGTPEEAAGPVYFFCAPESDYVSGEVLVCAGGYTF